MTTELMTTDPQLKPAPPPRPQPASKSTGRDMEPTVEEIIRKARSQPVAASGVWWASGLTAVLMWAAFTPLDWGPLGWVCLVPLVLVIRIPMRIRRMYLAVYLGGLATTLASLQWMRLGDPWMYPAWMALSAYIAIYFPLFVGICRVAVHRFSLPLALAVPVVWTATEYLRAHVMTGYAWYYLGHTQYRWIELIQISDIVGAYGVTFLLTLTAACLAGLVPEAWFPKLRLMPKARPALLDSAEKPTSPENAGWKKLVIAPAVCLTMFAAVLGYGYWRRSQADFQPGPRVALIQGNFTISRKTDQNSWPEIYRTHERLTGMAVKHQPQLVVWPETMFPWPMFNAAEGMTDEQLKKLAPWVSPQLWRDESIRKILPQMSRMAGAAMIVGISVWDAEPGRLSHYNSAMFVRPDVGITGRYDKMHRVPFGEFMPLAEDLPWLAQLSTGPTPGLQAGDSVAVFNYGGARFAPVICFEDTVPHLVRRIVKSAGNVQSPEEAAVGTNTDKTRPLDCLINVTNDGWFHGSSELNQHLITASFRCVETRTPMLRAVNTGISAVIDGDGVVREPDVFIDGDHQGRKSIRDPETGELHKDLNAVLVSTVPLDNRSSLYVAAGDWFAGSCTLFTVLLGMAGVFFRRRGPNGIVVESAKTPTV